MPKLIVIAPRKGLRVSLSRTPQDSTKRDKRRRVSTEASRPNVQGKVIVVVGPTASGKSNLSIFLAQKLNGEIISADSRQVYRGMDIGTGKVSKEEQKLVPHHLLNIANPKNDFSVAQYKKLGERVIQDILKRRKIPIIVGGTGFYIDALLGQNFPEVPPNKNLRSQFDKLTAEELFRKLKELDPRRAETIDAKNKRRLIRALEIVFTTGKSVPKIKNTQKYEILWIGINWPKKKLEKRINTRLDKRLSKGMIQEVRKLHRKDMSWKRLENFGLEYRYISRYLQARELLKKMKRRKKPLKKLGVIKFPDWLFAERNPASRSPEQELRKWASGAWMKEGLTRAIFQYAKRQVTWFKRNKNIHWVTTKNQAIKLSKEFTVRSLDSRSFPGILQEHQ